VAPICDDACVRLSIASRRVALPLIALAAYATDAITPCAPIPAGGATPHDREAIERSGTASLVAPCPCGCDDRGSGEGSAKRAEPGLRPEVAALPESGRWFESEPAARLPEAPISVETPVPIAT